MNFHQLIQDYFTFSRNERRGITILLTLIFILAIANKVIFYFEEPAKINLTLLDSAKNELALIQDLKEPTRNDLSLFYFNPNTVDSLELDQLNLPVSVKNNLLKFRSKGGKIYSVSDFRKIYGISDSIFDQVSSFIKLDAELKSAIPTSNSTQLFRFNPNLATDKDFASLGLTDRQISNIRKYQNKGGTFRNLNDFFKIYGLNEAQKKSLADFVFFDEPNDLHSSDIEVKNEKLIELNDADSTLLKQLPGIGTKLSKRMIKYRDLLGGFYSREQLKEVYGLNEVTILGFSKLITIDTTKIRKLNLNFADEFEFSRHPYLSKKQAAKIVKFRTKNGSFHQLSVLQDSMILNIEEFKRIRPYFSEQK